jgi:hypothetical protein
MGLRRQKIISSKVLFLHGEVSVGTDGVVTIGLIPCIGINLAKLVPELDSTATDIVTHQRDALLSRKDLAQKTKDFRKLDDTTKLVEFKSLLKGHNDHSCLLML